MKRRNFSKSILLALGASGIPMGVSLASLNQQNDFMKNHKITSDDGLELLLDQVVNPTSNKDRKQFILTYNVENRVDALEEKIYHLSVNGRSHEVYMTPVNDHQLQAVFNWRLNA